MWLAKEVYGAAELRAVAVKLFPLVEAERLRIIDEARALCRVEHPNVVRFYALTIDEARGVIGLAMEHVAGVPLDRRLAERGRLVVLETLHVGIAVASALAAVHRAGLVHRDVKPANVIEAAGVYKLIDFGIAAADERSSAPPRALQRSLDVGVVDGETSTAPFGAVTGTAGYTDPRCLATGAPAVAASDLYALGALLFECLVGRLPAASPLGDGLRAEVLDGREPPPSLGEMAPDVPPALARLVAALLSPERASRPASAEWLAIRLEQIRTELLGSARPLPPESVGPFRGLGRYKESDRGVYFGRGSDVAAALEVLRGRGLAAIVGPSGSGKSSLARAGVLPAVAEGALGGWPAAWDTVIAEPGSDPRAALGLALAAIVPGASELTPEALALALAERAARVGRGLIVLVDQLEELTTVASGPGRAWATALLVRLSEQALPGLRALITVRRDLLDPLLAFEGLGRALIHGSVLIEPLHGLSWGVVLERALAAYGYTFEDDALRAAIMVEIEATGNAMPLVMFALTELWDRRDAATRTITHQGFAAMGGLTGALTRHAEATLAELGEEIEGAEGAARAVLLALTTPRGTRAAKSAEELVRVAGPAAREVLSAFERARLIVAGEGGVALVHEALLTQWERLRGWVEEARDERMIIEELERDAARRRESPELVPLWKKHRLAFGEELLRRADPGLSADAVAFLRAARWAERRARIAILASVVAALLAVIGVGVGYIRAVQAKEDATRRALVREQESRALAEKRAREVEEAQREIDRLVRNLADSPSKDTVLELQRQIRAGKIEAPADKPVIAVAPRAPHDVVPALSTSAPEEAPRPPQAPAPPSASAASTPGLGVEKVW